MQDKLISRIKKAPPSLTKGISIAYKPNRSNGGESCLIFILKRRCCDSADAYKLENSNIEINLKELFHIRQIRRF